MIKKKILIITYYWPPSGGGGVQRWLKMTKYLPELGWEPIVYTPQNPFVEEQDESLLADVSDQVRVIKRPIWEPYRFLKFFGKQHATRKAGVLQNKPGFVGRLLIWIRGNLFVPDPRKFWTKPSIAYLRKIIEDEQIRYVITTSPPHSMHLIGLGLKRIFGDRIRWLVDFRDPWTKWDLLREMNPISLVMRKHRKQERQVLDHADLVVTVSPSWKSEFEELGARNVHVVTNGFDAEDFSHLDWSAGFEGIRFAHFGLLNSFRNPAKFWQELATYTKKIPNFTLHLGGIIDEDIQLELKDLFGDKLILEGYIPHSEVLKAYQKASVLILISNASENAKGHLPGKLFEYMATGRKILAIAPADSDLATIIRSNDMGLVCDPADAHDFHRNLQEIFELGQLFRKNDTDLFSRKTLIKQYADLIASGDPKHG